MSCSHEQQNHFLHNIDFCTSCTSKLTQRQKYLVNTYQARNLLKVYAISVQVLLFFFFFFFYSNPWNVHISLLNRQILLTGFIVANSPAVRTANCLPSPIQCHLKLRLTSKQDPPHFIQGTSQLRKRRHRRAPQLQLSLLLASSMGNL